ncbi:MAG: hypothetical protein ABFS45_22115 [Pseudomonadota bacterium]
MTNEETQTEEPRIGEFLLARGGPFYALQRQLGLLREDAFRAGSRALLFVGLAWGVPLFLSLIAGDAVGSATDKPYLLDLAVWARFFIAVGLFMLMERQVEERLRAHLVQFARAPLLAPGSFEAAARAVTRALKRRDGFIAEAVCLIIAILITIATFFRLLDTGSASWAVRIAQDGNALTLAGWWTVAVSNPIFWFLLLRWLWRLLVWSMLLRELASLELRLVATHPDSHGGLAFIGQYPNAYATFVFAVSCVLGAALAHELLAGDLAPATYGYVMGAWLLMILALFAYPLFAFRKPLTELKERTQLACSAQATRHLRAAEREILGRNISAAGDAEPVAAQEIPDPSKLFTTAGKLSTLLVSRTALLPVSAAALLPLVAASATQLPLKEILKVVKRLLLL